MNAVCAEWKLPLWDRIETMGEDITRSYPDVIKFDQEKNEAPRRPRDPIVDCESEFRPPRILNRAASEEDEVPLGHMVNMSLSTESMFSFFEKSDRFMADLDPHFEPEDFEWQTFSSRFRAVVDNETLYKACMGKAKMDQEQIHQLNPITDHLATFF